VCCPYQRNDLSQLLDKNSSPIRCEEEILEIASYEIVEHNNRELDVKIQNNEIALLYPFRENSSSLCFFSLPIRFIGIDRRARDRSERISK
jgi:hypothetical protein